MAGGGRRARPVHAAASSASGGAGEHADAAERDLCTLCSCTAFTIIGLPPDWYKDLEYRARVVRQSRTVLKEMGLDLPPEIEIRVWDTTADTRYMVLPVQPPETDRLAGGEAGGASSPRNR